MLLQYELSSKNTDSFIWDVAGIKQRERDFLLVEIKKIGREVEKKEIYYKWQKEVKATRQLHRLCTVYIHIVQTETHCQLTPLWTPQKWELKLLSKSDHHFHPTIQHILSNPASQRPLHKDSCEKIHHMAEPHKHSLLFWNDYLNPVLCSKHHHR